MIVVTLKLTSLVRSKRPRLCKEAFLPLLVVLEEWALVVFVFVLGGLLAAPWIELAGLILWDHSALDRALGYGFKSPESFHLTPLGSIGKLSSAGQGKPWRQNSV
jgi:Domain of unknown function (DUF4260)